MRAAVFLPLLVLTLGRTSTGLCCQLDPESERGCVRTNSTPASSPLLDPVQVIPQVSHHGTRVTPTDLESECLHRTPSGSHQYPQ